MRWPNPMQSGDLLILDVNAQESSIAQSRTCHGGVRRQRMTCSRHEAPVLELEATSMFRIGREGAVLSVQTA